MHQTDDPNEVYEALKLGKPCIGANGPGEFTQSGHFLLLMISEIQGQASQNSLMNTPVVEVISLLGGWYVAGK